MIEISLEGLEFFAYHGFYNEEQIIGNKYAVDVKVEIENEFLNEDLNTSVNYEIIYSIVKDRMQIKTKLLETIAQDISNQINAKFPFVIKISVSISKFNPPVGGICRIAKVTFIK